MNDALGAAGRAHGPLFEELGLDFVEINFGNQGWQQLMADRLSQGQIAFAYGAVGLGADMQGTRADGSQANLWSANRIPYISISGDSPAYFFQRHLSLSQWHANLYFFPEHFDLRRTLDPSPGLCGVIPPVPFDQAPLQSIDFRKKASGTLIFLKNGNDPARLVETWRKTVPSATFLLLADMAGELSSSLTSDASYDLDRFVCARFLDKGWDLHDALNMRLFFLAQLDDYLRRVKSQLVADAIADFPVVIQGYNWDHMDFSKRKAKYVKGGDYTASRQQIADSLGMIDMSPNTQRVPHDRVLRSFGLYTLCITNRQSYLTEHIPAADQFTYNFRKEEVQERVAWVLDNRSQAVDLGIAAAEAFRLNHHPIDFAQFMTDTASHLRIAGGERPDGLQDFFVWPPASA